MKLYNVAIVGSRSLDSNDAAAAMGINIIEAIVLNDHCTSLVSGGALGPDTWAERVASTHATPITVHLPDWNTHGRRAGFLRNQLIVDDADAIIALWDGHSRGTWSTINLALRDHKPVVLYTWNKTWGSYERRTL